MSERSEWSAPEALAYAHKLESEVGDLNRALTLAQDEYHRVNATLEATREMLAHFKARCRDRRGAAEWFASILGRSVSNPWVAYEHFLAENPAWKKRFRPNAPARA